MGMEYFWTGVGFVYCARTVLARRPAPSISSVKPSTGGGHSSPDVSTGMSSYLSKLMPVDWRGVPKSWSSVLREGGVRGWGVGGGGGAGGT
jgi:hypothetical protein